MSRPLWRFLWTERCRPPLVTSLSIRYVFTCCIIDVRRASHLPLPVCVQAQVALAVFAQVTRALEGVRALPVLLYPTGAVYAVPLPSWSQDATPLMRCPSPRRWQYSLPPVVKTLTPNARPWQRWRRCCPRHFAAPCPLYHKSMARVIRTARGLLHSCCEATASLRMMRRGHCTTSAPCTKI